MKTVTVWTKTGLKFSYELRDEQTDKVEIYADILAITGWIHEYCTQETDSGMIRSTTRQAKVQAFIPWGNLEYYEITEETA
jgi:hypothetical protein